jgi:PEP-CTERM motif.
MRKRFLLVTAMLLPLASSPAAAQTSFGCALPAHLSSPFAFVSVNGQCTDLSSFIVAQTKGWSLNTQAVLAGSTVDLHAIFNPDPSITFGGTTGNPSLTATTYAFIFGTPIVPDMYSLAISSVQFSATSAQGTTTVSNSGAQPTYIVGYGSHGNTLTNLGVDAGTADCVASGTAASTTCAAEGRTNTFAPTLYDNLEAFVAYTQDNQLSTATFNGSIRLEQANASTVTPEPSTLALLATGLLVLGGYRARRRPRRRA